jgi:uncharacterized protein (DUF4415 family)
MPLPFGDVLAHFQDAGPGWTASRRRPGAPKRSPPQAVTIRLDRDVLAHFQDEGLGWQERLNAALRKATGLDDAKEV